ncbi:MAG: TetR/AcrR family transcriptional regulator [Lachnospiraceae bacterium]|nr:TetR/AcrR family transcriptional regulator [Lachnospiraceae bacterium]
MKDNYHHGDLRNALIEAGIRIINESGEDALSLRKAAAACGVSHAAPYAHFPDKESLLAAIKETVTNGFIKELESAANNKKVKNAEEAILAMGERYILFFEKNPDYFNFLFHKQKLEVHTDMNKEYDDDYAPFLIFKKYLEKYFEESGLELTDKEKEIGLLKNWGLVQGLASIASMENVNVTLSWKVLAKECLK